jgi:hypothetical protein
LVPFQTAFNKGLLTFAIGSQLVPWLANDAGIGTSETRAAVKSAIIDLEVASFFTGGKDEPRVTADANCLRFELMKAVVDLP